MKRRTLKQQIPQAVEQLSAPVQKYLAASDRVAPDLLHSYERSIEVGLVKLMRIHLTLEPSWPRQKRWLDGLSEEFWWERRSGVLYGSGELFWGHWPEVSLKITGAPFHAMLRHFPRHGVEYRLRYEAGDRVRSFASRRWCRSRH